jgi:hypothetical protein
VRVDRPRDELLAGAALSRQEHGRFAVLEILDEAKDPDHGGRARHQCAEGDGAPWLQCLLFRRTNDDDVGDTRIADAFDRLAERRNRHGDEAPLSARGKQRSPSLTPLSHQERLPKRPLQAEQLWSEDLFDGLPLSLMRGTGTGELIKRGGRVDQPKGGVKAEEDPSQRLECGTHRDPGDPGRIGIRLVLGHRPILASDRRDRRR